MRDTSITYLKDWKREKAANDLSEAAEFARLDGHEELADKLVKLVNEMRATKGGK